MTDPAGLRFVRSFAVRSVSHVFVDIMLYVLTVSVFFSLGIILQLFDQKLEFLVFSHPTHLEI